MNNYYLRSFITAIMLLCTCMAVFANHANSALDNQKQAQKVLNKALEASGGYDALSAFSEGKIDFSIRNGRVDQGPQAW